MTSKLFFALGCLFFLACTKNEPIIYFPNNFECEIDGKLFALKYDSAFVKLSGMSTDYNEKTKTMKMEGSSYFGGIHFTIELRNFSSKGILNSDSIFVLYRDATSLDPNEDEYELGRVQKSNFEILEFGVSNNEVKGTFSFTLAPIIKTRGLKPKIITNGKFRFQL